MNPRHGPEYLANTRAKLLEIVAATGASGISIRRAAEAMPMSMGGCFGHMRALIDSRQVVRDGGGHQVRYLTTLFFEEAQQADQSERAKGLRPLVVEGRVHFLAPNVVRSVFELGASLG